MHNIYSMTTQKGLDKMFKNGIEYFTNMCYSIFRIRKIWRVKDMKASEVASWFLNYNNYIIGLTDNEGITNMKLQKLLYYAQGYYLANLGKPLFKDKILAWEHGPVVKKVYDNYKSFGSNSIDVFSLNKEAAKFFHDYEKVVLTKEVEDFLVNIYNYFGQFTAWGLRNMTHVEKPWLDTQKNEEIYQSKMKEYFSNDPYKLFNM